MEQNQSPFRIERRLTPELYDHYVARARAERSRAIAAFFGQIVGWLGASRPSTAISAGRKLTS